MPKLTLAATDQYTILIEPADWSQVFAGDAIMASAALDRLLHRSTVINIRGDSYRLKEKRKTRASLSQEVISEPSPRIWIVPLCLLMRGQF